MKKIVFIILMLVTLSASTGFSEDIEDIDISKLKRVKVTQGLKVFVYELEEVKLALHAGSPRHNTKKYSDIEVYNISSGGTFVSAVENQLVLINIKADDSSILCSLKLKVDEAYYGFSGEERYLRSEVLSDCQLD